MNEGATRCATAAAAAGVAAVVVGSDGTVVVLGPSTCTCSGAYTVLGNDGPSNAHRGGSGDVGDAGDHGSQHGRAADRQPGERADDQSTDEQNDTLPGDHLVERLFESAGGPEPLCEDQRDGTTDNTSRVFSSGGNAVGRDIRNLLDQIKLRPEPDSLKRDMFFGWVHHDIH